MNERLPRPTDVLGPNALLYVLVLHELFCSDYLFGVLLLPLDLAWRFEPLQLYSTRFSDWDFSNLTLSIVDTPSHFELGTVLPSWPLGLRLS